VYVDKHGNGKGKEGYVERERVWKVGRKPKVGWAARKEVKTKGLEKGEEGQKQESTEVRTAEGHDELRGLLGLGLMPIETGPQKSGVAVALP